MTTVFGRSGAIGSIHARTCLTAAMNSGGCGAVHQGRPTPHRSPSAGRTWRWPTRSLPPGRSRRGGVVGADHPHLAVRESRRSVASPWRRRGGWCSRPAGKQSLPTRCRRAHTRQGTRRFPGRGPRHVDAVAFDDGAARSLDGRRVGREEKAGSQAAVTAMRVVAARPVTTASPLWLRESSGAVSGRDRALDLSVGCGHADDPRCHRRRRHPCAWS